MNIQTFNNILLLKNYSLNDIPLGIDPTAQIIDTLVRNDITYYLVKHMEYYTNTRYTDFLLAESWIQPNNTDIVQLCSIAERKASRENNKCSVKIAELFPNFDQSKLLGKNVQSGNYGVKNAMNKNFPCIVTKYNIYTINNGLKRIPNSVYNKNINILFI